MLKKISFLFIVALVVSIFNLGVMAATSGTGLATVFGPVEDKGHSDADQSNIHKNNAGGFSSKQIDQFLTEVKQGKYDGLCAMNANDLKQSKLMSKFIQVTHNGKTVTLRIVDELPNGDVNPSGGKQNTNHAIDIYSEASNVKSDANPFYKLTGMAADQVTVSWKVVSSPSTSGGASKGPAAYSNKQSKATSSNDKNAATRAALKKSLNFKVGNTTINMGLKEGTVITYYSVKYVIDSMRSTSIKLHAKKITSNKLTINLTSDGHIKS